MKIIIWKKITWFSSRNCFLSKKNSEDNNANITTKAVNDVLETHDEGKMKFSKDLLTIPASSVNIV